MLTSLRKAETLKLIRFDDTRTSGRSVPSITLDNKIISKISKISNAMLLPSLAKSVGQVSAVEWRPRLSRNPTQHFVRYSSPSIVPKMPSKSSACLTTSPFMKSRYCAKIAKYCYLRCQTWLRDQVSVSCQAVSSMHLHFTSPVRPIFI